MYIRFTDGCKVADFTIEDLASKLGLDFKPGIVRMGIRKDGSEIAAETSAINEELCDFPGITLVKKNENDWWDTMCVAELPNELDPIPVTRLYPGDDNYYDDWIARVAYNKREDTDVSRPVIYVDSQDASIVDARKYTVGDAAFYAATEGQLMETLEDEEIFNAKGKVFNS